MRKFALLSLLLLAFAFPSNAARKTATIKVVNNSKWEIHHLYLSSTSNKHWGPDQLGDNIIESGGGKYTLTDIDCDHYDIKIVDEDGDECVIEDVEMCGDHTIWKITDKNLLACENESD